MNDEAKNNMRELFARVGDWLYDHAAETLAAAVALVGGSAFGIWLYLGVVSDRIDVISREQHHERLCQRISDCEIWRHVAAATEQCEKDQMLCQDRIANILSRMLEIERRINRTDRMSN